MPTYSLVDGDDMVLITSGDNEDFICLGDIDVGNFQKDFTVDECESDGNQSVDYDTSGPVTDSNSNTYYRIVGGRPRSRVRS